MARKIILAGGTGLIGQALSKALVEDGYEVWALTRNPETANLYRGVRAARWDGRNPDGWAKTAAGAEAIINLAGANLSRWPWTRAYREQIRSSRVHSGKAITAAVFQLEDRPKAVLQIAGVGFYGNRGDTPLDEKASPGDDFLAGVSRDWEDATRPVADLGVRHVILRTGVVLSEKGGALAPFLLQTRLFIGGPLGNGKQWMSWIHIQDLVNVFRFLLEHQEADGIFNVTSPQPVTNATFGRTMAHVLRRPYWLPVPAFALRLVLGGMSAVVLEGQRVLPERLLEKGFTFQYPELLPALESIL